MRRRALLKSAAVGTGALAAASTGLATTATAAHAAPATGGASTDGATVPLQRTIVGRALRVEAAWQDYPDRFPAHPDNGDEQRFPGLASYAKGLPHNDVGEVDPAAFQALLHAVQTGKPADFDKIPMGVAGGRKQLGPQGGLAYDLLGVDSYGLVVPPAPTISGAEGAGEMAELYWMSLLRDVPFSEYGSSPLVAEAAADLSRFTALKAPRLGGAVTPDTLFRSPLPGDLIGPYISQFLQQPVQFGTTRFAQLRDTVAPGVDYGTTFADWLALQRGAPRATTRDFVNQRYLQNGRDMAHYTHFDVLYQPYLWAALILLASPDYPAKLQDPGNPYYASANQVGFNSYGTPHLTSLLADVAVRAIKHTEYQQFFVHRRLRPEALGGRLHVHLEERPGRYPGMFHDSLLQDPVLAKSRARNGSYLLSQSFPEGSPMSPSYQSGHSTVAGACVTVLKAWFNESYVLPNPVVPSADGTALLSYSGPDKDRLTVGGELNKLAANIGAGRAFSGVHYRSDNAEAFTLGETIAIQLLREQRSVYLEKSSFTLTKFDGTTITI